MRVGLGRRWFGRAILKIFVTATLAGVGAGGIGARAQSAVDGAIAGRVISAEGTAIAGAEIVLEGEQGVQRSAVSGAKGEFLIVRLPPGEYTLHARASGYRGTIEMKTVVELGETTEVRVGQAIVSSAKSGKKRPNWRRKGATGQIRLLDLNGRPVVPEAATLRGTDSGVVGTADLDGLPVAGRDWTTLALESPGVHADPETDGANILTVRGLDSTQNSSQIDGVSHDQSFGGVPVGTGGSAGNIAGDGIGGGSGRGRHAGAAYTFSQSAVREFRLSENRYSALYGRAVGGVTTVVSRSGTNKLHGTAFLTLRESGWGASNPFSIQTSYANGVITCGVVKPQDLREQFGGSVGGAIRRDKLFYFVAYDEHRRNFPAISSPANAEFYALTPTQMGLLGTRGVTHAKTVAALNYLSSLTGRVPRRQQQTVIFGKLDWRAGGNNRVSMQYNRARWDSPAGATTAPVVARGMASLGNNEGEVDEIVGRWTTMLGAGFSNEGRVLYGRDFQYETAQVPLTQEPTVAPGGFAPQISIGPQGLLFGTPASLGRKAYPDERRLEIAESLSWIKGRHLIRAGGQISMVHDRVDALNNQEGSFSYDSGTTGGHAGGLVDWITDYTFNVNAYPNGGCPSINAAIHNFCFQSFSQSFGEETVSFATQEWSGYVQDDWRVQPGLKVNLGVRYEYELLPFPQRPNAALDATFGKVGATSVFPEDRNNFGPRAGVSWQPTWMHGGVIRAGYGLYFGRLPGTTIRHALVDTALVASSTHVRITPRTETECPQVPNQGFGYACAYLAAPPAAVGTTTSAMVFDRRFRLPAVQQASIHMEHGMGGGVVGSVGFVMNLDRQLPNSVDINIAPSTGMKTFQLSGGRDIPGVGNGDQFAVPIYTSRVNPNFGPVTDIVSNGNGNYSGLILEARQRTRGGFNLRVNWTWAKAIDYGQTSGGIPRTNGQFDPFVTGYDKGLSNLNYPHRLTVSARWAPVVRSEQRWIRAMVNGWEAAPVLLESSGRPYSYQIFGGTRLSGGHESINGAGGSNYLPTVGRNTLRLPEQMRVNLRISRTLRLQKGVRLHGVAEVFNLANRTNYSGVATRAFLVGTPVAGVTPLIFQDAATVAAEGLNVRPFGTFTEAGVSEARERRVQLGLRLNF